MKRALTLAAACFVSFAVGCGDQPTTPAIASQPDIAPTFDIAHAPTLTGIVLREAIPTGFFFYDADSQLGIMIGVDLQDYCAGTPEWSVVEFSDKLLRDRLNTNSLTPDMPVQVYYAATYDQWNCAYQADQDPLASGEVRVFSAENGIFGVDAKSSAETILGGNGELDDGSLLHFYFHYKESLGVIRATVTLQ